MVAGPERRAHARETWVVCFRCQDAGGGEVFCRLFRSADDDTDGDEAAQPDRSGAAVAGILTHERGIAGAGQDDGLFHVIEMGDEEFVVTESGDDCVVRQVQTAVQFAFARDDGAIPTEELFKDGHFEGSPKKVAVVRSEGGIVNSGSDDEGGIERWQGETTGETVIRQQQGGVERGDERVGLPGVDSG